MHRPELCFKHPLAKGLIPFNRTVPVRNMSALILQYSIPCDFVALQRVAMGRQIMRHFRWIYVRSLVQTRSEQRKRPRFEPARAKFAFNAPLREVRPTLGL